MKVTLTAEQYKKLKWMRQAMEKMASDLQDMFKEDMLNAINEETFDFIVRVNDGCKVEESRLKLLANLAVETFALHTKFDEACAAEVEKEEKPAKGWDKTDAGTDEWAVPEPVETPQKKEVEAKEEEDRLERPEDAAEDIAKACLNIDVDAKGNGAVMKALETAFNRGQRQGFKIGRMVNNNT